MKIAKIVEGITAIATPGEIAIKLPLSDYDLFIVNWPEPLQPEVVPLSDQVPEMVLLLTVPCNVNRLVLLPVD